MYAYLVFGTSASTPADPAPGRAVVFKLYAEDAPDACAAFCRLCEEGYLRGRVARIIPGFLLQGRAAPRPAAPAPPSMNDRHMHAHGRAGLLGVTPRMDFYVTYAPLPHLNGEQLVIGEVLHGMDVVRGLEHRPTGPRDAPREPIRFLAGGVCRDGLRGALDVHREWLRGADADGFGVDGNADLDDLEYPEDRIPPLGPDAARDVAARLKDAGNALYKRKAYTTAVARYTHAVRYLKWAERYLRRGCVGVGANSMNVHDEEGDDDAPVAADPRNTIAAMDEAESTALAVGARAADGTAIALPPEVHAVRALRATVYLNIAMAHLQAGGGAHTAGARLAAREAVKLDPSNPKAFYRYAQALMQDEDAAPRDGGPTPADAARGQAHDDLVYALAKAAYELAPSDPAVKALHAKAEAAHAARKKKFVSAMTAWTRTLSTEPKRIEFLDAAKKKPIAIFRCPDAGSGITYTFNNQERGRIRLVDLRTPRTISFPELRKSVAVPEDVAFPPAGLVTMCEEACVDVLQ